MTLTDQQLRDRLTALGCDVGPIDDTTRPLYVSMLKRREGASDKSAPASRSGRSSTMKSSASSPSTTSRTAGAVTSVPTVHVPRSRSSGRSRGGRSTHAFSSDDEPPDEEDFVAVSPRRRTTTAATTTTTSKTTTSPRQIAHAAHRRNDDGDKSLLAASSTMYSPPQESEFASNMDKIGAYSRGLFSPGLSPVRPVTPIPPAISRMDKYIRRPLHPPNSTFKINGSSNNKLYSSPSNLYTSTVGGGPMNGFSDDEHNDQPPARFSYRPITAWWSSGKGRTSSAYGASSVPSNQAAYPSGATHGSRPGRRPLATTSSGAGVARRSNLVSTLLIGVTVVFFAGLAFSYYRLSVADSSPAARSALDGLLTVVQYEEEKNIHDRHDAKTPFNYTLCVESSNASAVGDDSASESAGYDCISEKRLTDSLKAASIIQRALEQQNYERMCGSHVTKLDTEGGLPFESAALLIKSATEPPSSDDIFNGAVYLIERNPTWGVQKASGETQDSFRLLEYSAPLWCRLYRATMQVFLQMVLFSGFLGLLAGSYWMLMNRKVNLRERRRQINGLVEDITDMLTNNAVDNPETPYLPILEIRDKLLPSAATNRRMAQLWREVEDKFEGTECARVAREKQRVRGEWFQVWRWLPPPTLAANGEDGATSASSSGNKVWQGKAFDGTSGGQPLTNCLKIKNMFNKLEERGDDWKRDVQRELLAKCGPTHGIVHMHVAEDSLDGIVYVKMASLEAAGDVFRKLHGSWFDRRLVTAKYLREKRYHEKFPESVHCRLPMKL